MRWCRSIQIVCNRLNKKTLKGGILCIEQEVNQGFRLEICLDPIILTKAMSMYNIDSKGPLPCKSSGGQLASWPRGISWTEGGPYVGVDEKFNCMMHTDRAVRVVTRTSNAQSRVWWHRGLYRSAPSGGCLLPFLTLCSLYVLLSSFPGIPPNTTRRKKKTEKKKGGESLGKLEQPMGTFKKLFLCTYLCIVFLIARASRVRLLCITKIYDFRG